MRIGLVVAGGLSLALGLASVFAAGALKEMGTLCTGMRCDDEMFVAAFIGGGLLPVGYLIGILGAGLLIAGLVTDKRAIA